MGQTRRAKMHLRIVFILLVLSVVGAESCVDETHYMKNDKCCKMCAPGTRMVQDSGCEDPVCQDCAEGEYQNTYTSESLCKRQPACDSNLNFMSQAQSKTQFSPCECIPGYHCTNLQCDSCVKNTECQPGQKINKNGIQTADTVCERCKNGTFSNHKSALTCKPWTICSSGFKELSPGSSTADRICEAQSQKLSHIVTFVVFILLFMAVAGLFIYFYKKGRTGSVSFVQKLRVCTFWDDKNTRQPVQDNVYIENGQPQQPVNQPQEDTEDLVKLDAPLSPGVSENGMPVSQDHSKSLLLSEAETEPKSFCNDEQTV